MIEELLPNLYRVEIPLPRSPLKALNSYFIKGDGRFLMVDTGMNREECLLPMRDALKELNVDLNKTDFFITHLHADHSGLMGVLASESSKIYFNKTEASFVNFQPDEGYWMKHFVFYAANGFPEDEMKAVWKGHPGFRYSARRNIEFTPMVEGNQIQIGNYLFRCVETPGHSPGHMCLYEAEKKVLICGDHILFDITPNITHWEQLDNSLKHYLMNLEKVYGLDVSLILPGHRIVWDDHRRRIDELKEHHKHRLAEALDAVKDRGKTAWEVAPSITWDIDVKSWSEFPSVQKFFAVGETIAHLDYLVSEGEVRKETKNKLLYYSAT